MSLVLDAGGFIALERRDADIIAVLKAEHLAGRTPLTHGGIVAQVWRGGAGRQAPIARLLSIIDIEPLDTGLGRLAGVLLGESNTSDAIDAALIALCHDGDSVLTSDPDDLVALSRAAGLHIDIVSV